MKVAQVGDKQEGKSGVNNARSHKIHSEKFSWN